MNISQRSRENH